MQKYNARGLRIPTILRNNSYFYDDVLKIFINTKVNFIVSMSVSKTFLLRAHYLVVVNIDT
jgi:hypothetical protein